MARSLGVVVPHFNDSRFLAAALESCLVGERPPDRVLVIDDGSRREELAAVEAIMEELSGSFRSRLDLVRQPSNCGVIPTLNSGLAEIGTDYVLFRDADDRTLPGFFAGLMPQLEARPDAGLGIADLRYYTGSPDTGVVETLGLGRAGYFAPEELTHHLSATCILHSGTTIFERRRLAAAGGFAPDTDLYHDWWACHQLAFRHGLVYRPEPGTAFCLRADSVSSRCFQDLTRAQRSIAAVRTRLAKEPSSVQAAFSQARLLDFFAALEHRTVGGPAAPDAPVGGIEGALHRRLLEFAPALRAVEGRIYIYGAGNHTRALLREWYRLELPVISGILASQPDSAAFESLPVAMPQSVALQATDLLVLSSKSFEEAMAITAAEAQPHTPVLSFWNPDHTTLRLAPAGV